jgi:hypothetical protein
MKKTLIITILLASGVCISPILSAQDYTSLQYTVGIPFGSLKDHTSQVSGRGVTYEFQKEVAPSVTAGINLAYSVFYERKAYDSYTSGNATLTGVQYRYNNLFPVVVNAHYYIGEGAVMPYLGLGAGTLYDLRNTNMGIFSIEEKNWHFLIAPEAGFIFTLSSFMNLKLNAKYDNAFKTKDVNGFGNLNVSFGFVWNRF